MRHSAFGLSVAASRPIPGLTPLLVAQAPDIRVWFDEVPSFASAELERSYYVSDVEPRAPALHVWKAANDQYFRLRYADDTQFIVAATGDEVWTTAPSAASLEDTATYLLGPVLGFAMRLRGTICLHASVVAIGDHAIAIAGPAGAGKSTAAAWFASNGYAVLADDIAALVEHDGTLHVQPGYPQLRLWPDSVAMLFGTPEALPPLTPTWDKRAMQLSHAGGFQGRALPLRAVYVIGDADESAIDEITGAERLRILVANTYVGYLLDAAMRQREFEWLVRLAATVRVRRIGGRHDPSRVSTVCARLLKDCQRLHV